MLAQAATLLALAGAALAQTLSINTPPSIQQCQPAQFTITGGTAPYILAAIPQSQPTAAALATIVDNLNSQTYTWTVNLPAGTAINVRVTDATGAINYSSGLTVQQGSSGCLSGSASGSATSAVPASSGAGTSAPAASTTNASSVSSSVAAASSARATSATSAAAASSGAASSTSGAAAGSSSRAASSSAAAAASSTGAAGVKAAFQVPVLALAGAAAFTFLGGFAALA